MRVAVLVLGFLAGPIAAQYSLARMLETVLPAEVSGLERVPGEFAEALTTWWRTEGAQVDWHALRARTEESWRSRPLR